jgi:hypothetical protein
VNDGADRNHFVDGIDVLVFGAEFADEGEFCVD